MKRLYLFATLLLLVGFIPRYQTYRVPRDYAALLAVADSQGASRDVVLMAAWMESRDGAHWWVRGVGTPDTVWHDSTFTVHAHTCRETGRFQMRPCINWVKILGDPQCRMPALATKYWVGIHCGIENLARLQAIYADGTEVLHHQSGDPNGYVQDALSYGEWLHLKGYLP